MIDNRITTRGCRTIPGVPVAGCIAMSSPISGRTISAPPSNWQFFTSSAVIRRSRNRSWIGRVDGMPDESHNVAVGRRAPRDLTVVAVPLYFATMALERWWLRRRDRRGEPSAGDYERRDTIASLSMGLGSLVVPLVMPRLLRPFTPGRGRWGKGVIGVFAGAALATQAADLLLRQSDGTTTAPSEVADIDLPTRSTRPSFDQE